MEKHIVRAYKKAKKNAIFNNDETYEMCIKDFYISIAKNCQFSYTCIDNQSYLSEY